MPKQKNIIQFSLPEDLLNKLESLKKEDESLNLTAKRLLLHLLEDEPSLIQGNDYQDLCDRLSRVENFLQDLGQPPAQWTIDQLCERVEALESGASDQIALNQLIADCLSKNGMTLFSPALFPDKVPNPHEHKLKLIELGVDDDSWGEEWIFKEDGENDQPFDIKLYLEEVIGANQNGASHTTKKECIEYLRGYPHPLGLKWDYKGLNRLLNHYHLHWY